MKPPIFEVETQPGRGNLSAKAYYASIVGPRRVALGSKTKFILKNDVPVKLISNTGIAGASSACFVSVSLVPNQAAELVLFGSNETPSDDSGIPRVLSTAGTGVLTFEAVLNPGEMLYAYLPSTAAVGSEVSIVVSTEWY